jgi:thiol-disulfide isomerase/thioredoxin
LPYLCLVPGNQVVCPIQKGYENNETINPAFSTAGGNKSKGCEQGKRTGKPQGAQHLGNCLVFLTLKLSFSITSYFLFMKNIIFLTLVLLFSSCNSKKERKHEPDSFELQATIKGLGDTVIYARHASVDEEIVDTIHVKKGNFKLTGKLADPLVYSFIIANKGINNRVRVFVQNGNIIISGNIDSLDDIKVQGSAIHKEWEAYELSVGAFRKRLEEIEQQYGLLPEKNKAQEEARLDSTYEAIQAEEQKIALQFIRAHAASVLSPYLLLSKFAYDPELEILQPAYSNLDSAVKQTVYGKRVGQLVAATEATQPGNVAPGFSLADTSGNSISLDAFKGKVTLLDFWASWCGPCRKENPNLVKAYSKYHPKGFEILAVSLDDSKEKWISAIAKDKLAWVHVSDLRGWNNKIAKQYFIKSIPSNVLLDKEGKVVAKNLKGQELEQELAKLL